MDNTLITQDRLDEIVRLAGEAAVGGQFAEVGVYKGGSLKELHQHFPHVTILGFDTFEGLPKEQWNENEYHQPGEFSDTSLEEVQAFVGSTGVQLVKGLFPASATGYEHLNFSFVHIDTDFYQSVKASLEWFWPRLLPGGIIVMDDYEWPNCPGVKLALDEFGQPYQPTNAQYQAYIIKPL